MAKPPKTSFELAMERLRAADPAEAKAKPLSAEQKKAIAETRRVAAARLAEAEILSRDRLQQIQDPAEREKAERELQVDRRRIQEDCDIAIGLIRRGGG